MSRELLLAGLLAVGVPAFALAENPGPNVLALEVEPSSLAVRPGSAVALDLSVSNLIQMVSGCQALIGYSSSYWAPPMNVVPGGGAWTELIYESWVVPGELDTAVGVELSGPGGTMADATVAKITFTAGLLEGTTRIVFRPDPDLHYATFLSDLSSNPVWPAKIDSQWIVIDGTPPALGITSATQYGQELLISQGSTIAALRGAVDIELSAGDGLSGLSGPPQLTVLDGSSAAMPLTFLGEGPPGVYRYQTHVASDTGNGVATLIAEAVDRAGNVSSATGAFHVNSNEPVNILMLDVGASPLYVRPGMPVTVDLDVLNLARMVSGCQALIGYNSQYWTMPMQVAPGGGPWNELIYESWSVPGELDTAIGVELGGVAGTMADGTVATITLTAGSLDGSTRLAFRSDPDLKYATMLSDLSSEPVWPVKIDSQMIVIDGTAPALDIAHATQSAQELLVSLGHTTPAVQGAVSIQVTASDLLAGLAGRPTLAVTDSGGAPLVVTFVDEAPSGVFNYAVEVTSAAANGLAVVTAQVVDRCGNLAIDTDGYYINRNQARGTIEFLTLSHTTVYTCSRTVVLTASDAGGQVLAQWSPVVVFTNDPARQIAAGSYQLTAVPDAAVTLSAKTGWTLRRRQQMSLGIDGQALVDFRSSNNQALLGGDLDGSNVINLLDYSLLKSQWMTPSPATDVNGDGFVNLLDYSLMKANWYRIGDLP